VLGLTIDYGPYGWLDNFDPDWTPNTTDAHGKRYRFGRQPDIALWNLHKLGNALYPLVKEAEPLQEALSAYSTQFNLGWRAMMAAKLGLSESEQEDDGQLVSDLLDLLAATETDMTIFFRRLADVHLDSIAQSDALHESVMQPLMTAYYTPDRLEDHIGTMLVWLGRYARRIRNAGMPDRVRRKQMNRVNPKYVIRNYLAQLAIDKAEQGDSSMVNELLELSKRPYDEQPAMEHYAKKRPDWARRRAGCSMLSCSS